MRADGPAQHDRADQLLDRPAVVRRRRGEVVEQGGMARRADRLAPKLSGVGTSPRPIRCSQTRLAMTRAVSGLSLRRSSRPAPAGRCCSADGRLLGRQHLREAAADRFARLVELAAVQQSGIRDPGCRGRPSPGVSACHRMYRSKLALEQSLAGPDPNQPDTAILGIGSQLS